jgi:acyl-CoA thioesterase YciA
MRRDTKRDGDPLAPAEPRGELAARTLAMPADTNPSGDIFGGWIMSLMDAAGAISATRHAGCRVVTASVSNIAFLQPVKVGDVVCCYTDLRKIGRSSMTLGVEVWALRQGQEPRIKVTAAEFTFVALDDDGRPQPIGRDGDPAARSSLSYGPRRSAPGRTAPSARRRNAPSASA